MNTVSPTPPHPTTLETVTGPLSSEDVVVACAHEHLYADFLGPRHPGFVDVDWAATKAACSSSLSVLNQQGVNLLIDWTTPSLGRPILLLRELARTSGVNIVAASGLYQTMIPNEFDGMDIDGMADRFRREIEGGIDGTPVRAGFIKIATTEAGPTEGDTRIHQAAARAAVATGCAIALHSPYEAATMAVVDTLSKEGFGLSRLVWGHAQCSPHSAQLSLAKEGAFIAYDAISAKDDPFFFGPTDDASMLDRLEMMIGSGFGERIMVSTDASVVVNPPEIQYDRDNSYLHGVFCAKAQGAGRGEVSKCNSSRQCNASVPPGDNVGEA